jgi:GNAT superfamily N-acetyltransferase
MDLFDLAADIQVSSKQSLLSAPLNLEHEARTGSDIPVVQLLPGYQAAASEETVRRISQIFNESFGYRPDGKPYRLGPKSITERLQQTDYVFLAGGSDTAIGYLFGKEIPSSMGRIAWIESMAVLPIYRRQGVATSLLRSFVDATKAAPRLGCATPNPIAALIVSRVVEGKMFLGKCGTPYRIVQLLKEIRQHCFDLRGCSIDEANLTIKTGFSPLSRCDQREWRPRTFQPPPQWWNSVEHLPNEFEALLIIERRT